MSVNARATFRGLFAGLMCVAVAAVCALALLGFSSEQKKRAAIQPKLTAWSNERVLGELGEAQQVMDCEQIIGGPGFQARFFADEEHGRLIVVCTPAK